MNASKEDAGAMTALYVPWNDETVVFASPVPQLGGPAQCG